MNYIQSTLGYILYRALENLPKKFQPESKCYEFEIDDKLHSTRITKGQGISQQTSC